MAEPSISDKVREACTNLARYVRGRDYDSILTSGNSSEISIGLLKWAWGKQFSGAALPPTHVISPKGNGLLYEDGNGCFISEERKFNLLETYLLTNHPELASHREQRIVFVDDHMRGGAKISSIHPTLKKHGFLNVDFAFVVAFIPPEKFYGPPFFSGRVDPELVNVINSYAQNFPSRFKELIQ